MVLFLHLKCSSKNVLMHLDSENLLSVQISLMHVNVIFLYQRTWMLEVIYIKKDF